MKQRGHHNRSSKPVLVHHKHTGKILPIKHTSYPVLLFMLLMVGVLLVGLNNTALASDDSEDVNVTARVAGNPPTEPATILSPVDGTQAGSYLLPVQGTCPTATIIELYRNNLLNGSTLCSANNTFSMTANLFYGNNTLVTEIFNLGDTQGPSSQVINVYLPPPPQPPVTNNSGSTSVISSSGGSQTTSASTNKSTSAMQSEPPLLLQTSTAYQGVVAGENLTWKLNIGGGQAPYAIAVDWGDGSTSVLSQTQAGGFTLNHTYSQPGGFRGNYTVKIKASDSSNEQAYMQLFVLVSGNEGNGAIVTTSGSTGAAGGGSSSSGSSSSGGISSGLKKIVWSAYGVTTLMTASFWLGEKREILTLAKAVRPHRMHPRH